ncbi:valine--tRNA ligase, partial [Coemansia sp. RSA 1804]
MSSENKPQAIASDNAAGNSGSVVSPSAGAPAPETPLGSVPNSKNKEKNEAKRLAKINKFLAKQAAQNQQKAAGDSESGAKKEKKSKEKEVKAAVPKPKPKAAVAVTTPKGEKKDMSQPMAESYDPAAVEASWYEWWEKQ